MKATVQRQLILDAVEALDKHATAEEVYQYIAVKNPSIGKATVYRNLGRMAESGRLLSIGSLLGSVHYDHNTHEHHHFVCKVCESVYDVEGDFLGMIEAAAKSEMYEIEGFEIQFSGVCKKCKG